LGRIKISNTAFITGSAGFIGFHLAQTFLSKKWKVVGFDAMTNYYDVNLKKNRHVILEKNPAFFAYEGLIQDPKLLNEVYVRHKPNIIIHLAAQAGVRYSIDNPISYVESNLIGTFHILELARKYKPEHLLMASTSSVYGSNKDMPLHENQKSDTQMSFYAATKNQMRLWLTLILIYTIFQLLLLGFLLFMVHGEDLIWLYLNLLVIL
jgi:UDP-glucuronate 4-epimerase